MEVAVAYQSTIFVMGLMGLLQVVQLLMADVLLIREKHPPGYPIAADHSNMLFRANRAFMNTNESISIYILFVLFALFSQANAVWLNVCSGVYFTTRLLHMLCYYFDLKLMRSIAFGASLFALLGMFVLGMYQWF